MKRFAIPAAVLAAAAIAVPAAARPDKPRGDRHGAAGNIEMTVHTHTSQFRGPGGAPLLVETDPLAFPIARSSFSYSSVACASPAPFNDVALNFNPDYPGIDDPASVRYVLEGRVTRTAASGRHAKVKGTIDAFLCQNRAEGDRIDIAYRGTLRVVSDNEARFRGSFRITGGSGRFEDMKGAGSMHGKLTCLPGVLQRIGARSCAEAGMFTDAVFFRSRGDQPAVPDQVGGGLKGGYRDRTA